MSTKTETPEKDELTNGTPVPPIGGKVPLATPDAQHKGDGWVQVGPTNINKDPDAVLGNKNKKKKSD